MKRLCAALVAIAFYGTASVAVAVTIPIETTSTAGWTGSSGGAPLALSSTGSGIIPTVGTPGVWQAQFGFALPGDATNVTLTLDAFGVDDKGVVQLNGTDVTNATIFGTTGSGIFDFGAGAVAYTFTGFTNPTVATSPFNIGGANVLTVFVNNTGSSDPNSTATNSGGPTGFNLSGEVTYDQRVQTGVPEPATLTFLGLGLAGLALARYRKR